MALIRFYAYREKLVFPTVVQAEEGFYLDEEPVTVFDTSDGQRLRDRLRDCVGEENEIVPTPERSAAHDAGSPILEKLNLKRWLTFEAQASMYSIYTGADVINY